MNIRQNELGFCGACWAGYQLADSLAKLLQSRGVRIGTQKEMGFGCRVVAVVFNRQAYHPQNLYMMGLADPIHHHGALASALDTEVRHDLGIVPARLAQ